MSGASAGGRGGQGAPAPAGSANAVEKYTTPCQTIGAASNWPESATVSVHAIGAGPDAAAPSAAAPRAAAAVTSAAVHTPYLAAL